MRRRYQRKRVMRREENEVGQREMGGRAVDARLGCADPRGTALAESGILYSTYSP